MTSAYLLTKLAAYVPTPAAQLICQQPDIPVKLNSQRFQAATLFADFIGFTALGELFSRAGATGAEELTFLINGFYTQIIEVIEQFQGQVVKFSGDALTVIFPAEEIDLKTAVRRASECALAIQINISGSKTIETSQGTVPALAMRIGIGAGEVLACTVGGQLNRWEYVIAGEPIVEAATAQGRTQPGQVLLSKQAWAHVDGFFKGSTDEQGFVTITSATEPLESIEPTTLFWGNLPNEAMDLAEDALKMFIPGAIKARLQDQSEWLAELRHMTMVFIGVGGLDYEADNAADTLNQLIVAVQRETYEYEGSLNKVIVDDKGTVILLLFGAPPLTHEDDSQRAVSCALRLQDIAKRHKLKVSIGITEGSIFAGPVGAPSRQEYTVIGDPVNLAARLMQRGRSGEIIISGRVKERVESKFSTEDLGYITIKGKTSRIRAFRVTGEEGAQHQFLTRYFMKENPLVGRKKELEQIRRMAARARAGQLQILLLEGELGMGKSRLLGEMVQEWMSGTGAAYGSTSSSYSHQVPYQSWQRILSAIYGLMPDITPERQLARLAGSVAKLPEPPDQSGYWSERLPLLKDVIGVDIPDNEFSRQLTGELRRNNIFVFVEALIRVQTQSQPLLILLEDIQWADELSLALALQLAQTLCNTPVFLVLAYRPLPTNDETLTGMKRLKNARTIPLEPLSPDESMGMIDIMMGEKRLPLNTISVLLRRGNGNPFFIQESTRAVLDVMEQRNNHSLNTNDVFDLPGSIQDAILTRIDRLREAEKFTLKIASVIGTNFERSLLSDVHPVTETATKIDGQLEDLTQERLIRLETPEPTWEYAFRNVITQEVVYESLLLTQRRQLHTIIGDVLENLVPDEVERLAYHFSRSNDYRKGIRYLTLAAEKAKREYANQAAIDYISEMLALMSTAPAERTSERGRNSDSPSNSVAPVEHSQERRHTIISPEYWDILLERAQLYNLVGKRNEEAEDLGTLGILAEALNDDRRRVLSAKQWAHFYESMADYHSALEMIERAIPIAEQTGDESLLGEGYNHWGKILYLMGDYDNAFERLQRAFEIAQRRRDEVAQADSLFNQGLIIYFQADYETALDYFQQAVDLWRIIDDPIGLGNSLRNVGRAYYKIGEYMAAHKCYGQALDLHRKIGDSAGEALTQQYSAQVERSLGNYKMAEEMFTEALEMHQAMGDERGKAEGLAHIGFLYGQLGEHEKGLKKLADALNIIRGLNDDWSLSTALTYNGWLLTESGDYDQAQRDLQEVLRIERDLKPGTAEAKIMEVIAMLGRAALAREDLSLADTCANHALNFLGKNGTSGIEHPARVYLTIYEIFLANQKHDAAQSVLMQGKNYITAQANQIDDPVLRQTYLNIVPENQQLQTMGNLTT